MEITDQMTLSDVIAMGRAQPDPVVFFKGYLQHAASLCDDACRAEMDARTSRIKEMRSDAKVLRLAFAN